MSKTIIWPSSTKNYIYIITMLVKHCRFFWLLLFFLDSRKTIGKKRERKKFILEIHYICVFSLISLFFVCLLRLQSNNTVTVCVMMIEKKIFLPCYFFFLSNFINKTKMDSKWNLMTMMMMIRAAESINLILIHLRVSVFNK